MKYLKIKLPSNDWRFITAIKDNEIMHSIYPNYAVSANSANLKKATKAIDTYSQLNLKVALIEQGFNGLGGRFIND